MKFCWVIFGMLWLSSGVEPLTARGTDLPEDFMISLKDLKAQLKKEDGVHLLDVRPEAVYQRGHIPGALNLPVAQVEGQLSRLTDLLKVCSGTLVLYCGDAGCNDSTTVFLQLLEHDIPAERLRVFKGGWREWVRNRGAIQSGPAPAMTPHDAAP